MHNHNSDRSLATRRCASCRSRFVVRTRDCRSFVVQFTQQTSTGHVDQPAGRRVALLAQRCTRKENDHTHHSASTANTTRASQTHLSLATSDSSKCTYVQQRRRMRRGCTHATRRVKPLAGRRSVRRRRRASTALHCAHKHKQDRRARATFYYRQKNNHSHIHATDRCGVTESRSFFQRRAR